MKAFYTYRWLVGLSFLLFFSGLNAQEKGSLRGNVSLGDGQTPAPNLYVYLENTSLGALTDLAGNFVIGGIPAGVYQLTVSGVGFSTLQEEVAIGAGQQRELNMQIRETVIGLPEVVVEGVSLTGGLRGLEQIPGAAHYLSPQELARFRFTDINRILNNIPGVNMQEEDGFGLRPNIGLRGTGSERSSKITLMEDGVLAAPAPYAAPAAYYFPTVGRMRAVEILKGSSQIRFGPFTTGGAINFISTPIPEELSAGVQLSGGNFGNRNLHAFAGNSHRHFGYMVESFQFQSDGFKQLPGGGDTGFDKKDYLAKFRINTGPRAKVYQSLTFKVGLSEEVSNETYLGLTDADFADSPLRRYAGSQMDRMTTRHQQLSAQHLLRFSPSLDLITTVYRNEFRRNWYKLDKVAGEDGAAVGIASLLDDPGRYPGAFAVVNGGSSADPNALQVKANNREYLSQGVQTVLGWRFTTGAVTHTLDIGLRYHYDEMDRFQWVDGYRMAEGQMLLSTPGTPGTESNRLQSARALATYAQYKLSWGDWTFIPGLRYENMRLDRLDYGREDPERTGANLSTRVNHTDVVIPGLGVHYRVNGALQVFAGLHKGFSPPGTNAGSQPEISVNYESGLRYRQGALSGEAVLFYNDYRNLLGADLAAAGGGGNNRLYNGGEAVARGLELQMAYDMLGTGSSKWQLPVSLTYTFTDAFFQSSFESDFDGWGTVSDGDELPYIARHQLALLFSLRGVKFDLNLNARYQDAMRTQAGQGAIPAGQGTDAYLLLDLSAHYRLHPRASVFGGISNLTDARYVVARRPAGSRPGLPRTLRLGLEVEW